MGLLGEEKRKLGGEMRKWGTLQVPDCSWAFPGIRYHATGPQFSWEDGTRGRVGWKPVDGEKSRLVDEEEAGKAMGA